MRFAKRYVTKLYSNTKCCACRKIIRKGDYAVVEHISPDFFFTYCPECAERLGLCVVKDGFPKLF